jgi:uncharacterized delta-60 repeat protein
VTGKAARASRARACDTLIERQIVLAESLEGRTLLAIDNPSFETRDLSGWEIIEGSDMMAEVVGQFGDKGAIAGESFAAISSRDWSGLRQTFTAAAGDTLSGWAFFHSSNGRLAEDEARIEIRRRDEVVARPYFMNSQSLGRERSTPWTAWSYTFDEAGTYTIRAISESGTICPAAVTLGLDALEISSPPAVVAEADAYTVDAEQFGVAAPGVLSNDAARNGGVLSIELVTGPRHGTLALEADGSFTYVPTSGYDGVDSFVYAARDPAGNADEATVTLTVLDRPEPEHPAVTSIRSGTFTPREGELFRIEGAVSNPRGLPQTVVIEWGDGSSEELDLGLGLSFAASHRYEDPATYQVRITPHDDAPGTSQTATVLVMDVPPSLSIAGERDAAAGTEYVLELRGREGQDEAITSWTIDWGDGSVQTLEGNPDEARHTYADDGSYRILAWAMLDGERTAARFASTRLDREFGEEGVILRDFGGSETIMEVLRDAQGRLIVVGSHIGGAIALQRYYADGVLDETFGKAGTAVLEETGVAFDGELQADGKILVVGSYIESAGGPQRFLVRFNGDGSIDETFGEHGLLVVDALAVAVSEGKILVAATEGIRRYTADGMLDPTFGVGGTAAIDLTNVRGLTVQNNSILANGLSPGREGLSLVRLDRDGAVDGGFGEGGYVRLPITAGSYTDGRPQGGTRALAVSSDGKIVVGGASSRGATLVRLNADGSFDASFGAAGVAQTGVSGVLLGLRFDDDGRILASGDAGGGRDGFAVFRFEHDGRLDASFGSGGVFIIDFPGLLERANSLVTLDDGSIIAAGLARVSLFDFAIAKVIVDEGEDLTVVVE